jgi:hypothetical protein
LVFPEGVLVLNRTGAAVVRMCDGRSTSELISTLEAQFSEGDPDSPAAEGRSNVGAEVYEFLARLAQKGLLRDAGDP